MKRELERESCVCMCVFKPQQVIQENGWLTRKSEKSYRYAFNVNVSGRWKKQNHCTFAIVSSFFYLFVCTWEIVAHVCLGSDHLSSMFCSYAVVSTMVLVK